VFGSFQGRKRLKKPQEKAKRRDRTTLQKIAGPDVLTMPGAKNTG